MFLCLCVLNNLFRSFHYYLWAVSVYKDSNFSIDYQVFPRLICAKLRKVVQRCMTLCNIVQNALSRIVSLHCLSDTEDMDYGNPSLDYGPAGVDYGSP